jgi:hypothetical protein
MKVKAVQFVPLGRPVNRPGDYFPSNVSYGTFTKVMDVEHLRDCGEWDAYERLEVEVDVPEPVPEWIQELVDCIRVDDDKNIPGATVHPTAPENCRICAPRAQRILEAYRAHVEKCAKAAAERMSDWDAAGPNENLLDFRARLIREEFTKP